MAVRFDCPSCKANYEVADDLAGKMIMCRVCKKRGAVRSLAAKAGATSTAPAAGMTGMTGTATVSAASMAAASETSRRSFLVYAGGVVSSLIAIGTGAMLARQPWRRWSPPPTDQGPFRRFGPPPTDGKQDGKQDDKGAGQQGKGGGV